MNGLTAHVRLDGFDLEDGTLTLKLLYGEDREEMKGMRLGDEYLLHLEPGQREDC